MLETTGLADPAPIIATLKHGGRAGNRRAFRSRLGGHRGGRAPPPLCARWVAAGHDRPRRRSNQWIDDNFLIDAVVCLASAKHIVAHLDEEKPDGAVNEAVQQVAFSDKILLNKVDRPSGDRLRRSWLRRVL